MIILPSEEEQLEIEDTGTAVLISPVDHRQAPAASVVTANPPNVAATTDQADPVEATHSKEPERFFSWWLPVADVVINGIHHEDSAVRRNVIRMLVPLSQKFGPKHMAAIPLETPGLHALNEKYQVRLEMDRQDVNASVTETLERIQRLTEVCMREHARAKDMCESLVQAAQVLLKRYSTEEAKKIIGEQLLRCVTLVENERNLRLQVARFQASVPRKVPHVKTHDIDADISRAEGALQASYPAILPVMRQWYEAQLQNIDYEVAEMVRRACSDVWLEGLQGS